MATVSATTFFGGKVPPPPAPAAPALQGYGVSSGVQQDFANRVQNISQIKGKLQSGQQGLGSSLLQSSGQVAGFAGDLIGEGIKAIPGAQTALQTVAKPIVESKPVQAAGQAYQGWKAQHPEAAANLEAVVNIGSILPVGLGAGKVAGEAGALGAEAVTKTIPKAITNVTTATKAIIAHPAQTVTNIGNDLTTIVAKQLYGTDADKITASLKASYSKVPLPKGVMQEEAQTGKSFADFMSHKPYLSMPVKDAKWDTYGTAQSLREEAKPEAQALQNLLDTSHAMISEQKLIGEMKFAVEGVATGQDRIGVQQFIDRELPILVDQMGGKTAIGPNGERMVSVAAANKVKQALWDRSPFSPTASRADKLKSSVDYKMGQVIRKNIETGVSDADIRVLNGQLGDYYHAIETLENLHGGAAPGGKIGSLFTKVAGTVAGSPGGAIGSIAGYMTADKISELMMNPAITTGIKREALMQLKVQRPTIAQKVAEILKQRQAEAMARPRLPKPSAIYMPPSKGGTTPAQKIATERAAAGQATEMPQELIHQYIDILGSK